MHTHTYIKVCNNISTIKNRAQCDSHICLLQFSNDGQLYTQPPENIF